MRTPSRLLLLACSIPAIAAGEPGTSPKVDDRHPANAGGAPDAAVKSFSVAEGLTVDVWAAEPLLANPVALSFDERGRAFVAETYRRRSSMPDIRKNTDWVLPNLALRTVAERDAFLKSEYAPEKNLKPSKDRPDLNVDGKFDWTDLQVESERVKVIEDFDNDGKADQSSVFVEGFNKVSTGVGAGVLAQGGEVWFTCAPEVWRLSGEGTPQRKDPILSGFGVHVVYSGHDMHGIKFGPDGRIYWSIADCGARVTTKEGKVIAVPDSGAVFRADPDGSNMELYAWGLRNPQSLAFNDVGDLFTGDNNADGGDKARWEHIVEGGDYGWRLGWQFLPKLGAWNSEKLWELNRGQTALSLLPSVGHIGHGPAGIAYYPGTGLPEKFRGHFFYADFPGGVRSFALQPKGASYTVENPGDVLQDNTAKQMNGKLLWNLYPSDVAFNSNGGLYVLDWVQGWEKTGKGRIFRVHDPAVDSSPLVRETRELLATGMKDRANHVLAKLLNHPDQRVRLAAQWELARRGESAAETLSEVAVGKGGMLPRLHAIWGLGQVARRDPGPFQAVAKRLLQDNDSEVQAQTAKMIGELKLSQFAPEVLALFSSQEPRVRFFAAEAAGKLGAPNIPAALFKLLERNDDRDAFVRHAAVVALSRSARPSELLAESRHPSSSVRAGALLALRRLGSPEVSRFLSDSTRQLVLEAARAIHDEPIPDAMPQLAALGNQPGVPLFVARRALNASYRLGTAEEAHRLAELANSADASETIRLDALEALGQWRTDLGRDRIVGLYRPLPAGRSNSAADSEISRILPDLIRSAPVPVQLAALDAARTLKLAETESTLVTAALNRELDDAVRAATLRALASFESSRLPEILRTALTENGQALLEEARKLSARFLPEGAVEQIAITLQTGTTREKQNALNTLSSLATPAADKLLATLLDRLRIGKVPAAIQLDLIEAAAARPAPEIRAKLAAFEKTRSSTDPLARWREALEGGDAKIGKEIFNEKAEAACMRCHKVNSIGGDVGPDLAGFGKKHDREYILASIVTPNAVIAPGYENNLITLNDGNIVAGIVTAEDGTELTVTPIGGGEKVKVPRSAIKQRDKIPSAMPEGLGEVLGKRDLRNVVEYLARLK